MLWDAVGIEAPTHVHRCLCSRADVQREGSPGGSSGDPWGAVRLSLTLSDALFCVV